MRVTFRTVPVPFARFAMKKPLFFFGPACYNKHAERLIRHWELCIRPVIAKTLEEINPTEVEFFLAEKVLRHDQRDREILDVIRDALPDKLTLRIQNIKIALIATLNVQEGKIPFKK